MAHHLGGQFAGRNYLVLCGACTAAGQYVGLFLVVFHFSVPFVLLLSRPFKRDITRLVWLAAWMLLMRYVDLFWHIEPNFSKTFTVTWRTWWSRSRWAASGWRTSSATSVRSRWFPPTTRLRRKYWSPRMSNEQIGNHEMSGTGRLRARGSEPPWRDAIFLLGLAVVVVRHLSLVFGMYSFLDTYEKRTSSDEPHGGAEDATPALSPRRHAGFPAAAPGDQRATSFANSSSRKTTSSPATTGWIRRRASCGFQSTAPWN